MSKTILVGKPEKSEGVQTGLVCLLLCDTEYRGDGAGGLLAPHSKHFILTKHPSTLTFLLPPRCFIFLHILCDNPNVMHCSNLLSVYFVPLEHECHRARAWPVLGSPGLAPGHMGR
jgi:hypothetical protein